MSFKQLTCTPVLRLSLSFALIMLGLEIGGLRKSAYAERRDDDGDAIVKARRFVVQSPDGKEAATFGFSDKPGEGLTLKMLDKKGKDRLVFMVQGETDGPYILLRDANGTIRLSCSLGLGEPEFDMYNASGKSNLFLRACDATGSGLVACHKGKKRVMLLSNGTILDKYHDEDEEQKRAPLGDHGVLALFDHSQEEVAVVPTK